MTDQEIADKKAKRKAYQDAYNAANKERKAAYNAAYYIANKPKVKEANAAWRAENGEHYRASLAQWRAVNQEERVAYRKATRARTNEINAERRANDIQFAMAARVRQRLRNALLRAKTEKLTATFDLIGCSIQDLVVHLESQFVDSMSWDNRSEWHIDHKIPCASFDLTDPEQQKLCFHWTNLQPLWGVDNIKKGTKLET